MSEQPRILNMRNVFQVPPSAVRVDRKSAWGNPFMMGKESQRNEVCDKFEAYALERLRTEPEWLEPLRGKDLVCWCASKRCHAETLRRLANQPAGA